MKIEPTEPQDIGALSPPVLGIESDVKIPIYDESSQLGVTDLDSLYPEWRQEKPESLSDPELLLFDLVRTQELRRIGQEQQVPYDMAAEGLEKAILKMPDEVGGRFQAHGIAGKRGSSSSELDVLLKQGIDPSKHLYTTQLRQNIEASGALGADMPFTEGGLITVSDADTQLNESGIKYVIVGEQYLKCFDTMQERYKDTGVKFVTWHDAPKFFCDVINNKEGTNFVPKQIDYSESYEVGQNTNLPGAYHDVGSVALDEVIQLINLSDDDSDVDLVW